MGANVQLLVSNVSYVGFKDRALNHSEYCELLVRGDVIQSDATVNGLPDPIPQTVRLLFRPGRQLDMLMLPFGREAALKAVGTSGDQCCTLAIDIFADEPDSIASKIEGGMEQSQFNEFVIRFDDPDFASVGCAVL